MVRVFLSLALATSVVSAQRQFNVPSLPLSNAAAPGMSMPFTGLGTGGYRSGLSPLPPTAYPESWNGDQNATVAAAVTAAVAGYIQLAAAGGVQSIRIDNADSYTNVASVGAGLRASGVPRERIWLLTKVGNGQAMGYQDVLDQWASIQATQQVDHVEMMLIHWPTATAPSKEPACNAGATYNATKCRLETWRACVHLFSTGAARAIGVSNYYPEHLEEIRAAGMIMPSINQIPFHLYRSSSWEATRTYCLMHGIAINACVACWWWGVEGVRSTVGRVSSVLLIEALQRL